MQEKNIELDRISQYSEDELRQYYLSLYNGSQAAFIRTYGLNRTNFSKWTGGKTSYNAAVNAMRQYLFDYCKPESSVRAQNAEHPEQKIDLSSEIAEKSSKKIAISPFALVNKLSSLYDLKTILFFDIDNMFTYFTNNFLFLTKLPAIHCIFVLSQKTIPLTLQRKLSGDNCSILRSKTTAKNAADTLMTAVSATLNLVLDNNISFILVSKDGFIGELQPFLRSFKRPAHAVIPEKLIDQLEEVKSTWTSLHTSTDV